MKNNEEIKRLEAIGTRRRRIWYPGATYHITSRGIRKSVIFVEQDDYKIFMLILQYTQEKMPFQLHSYCLMSNHFHLLLTTYEMEIGKIMQLILGNYARYFNRKYGYKGHLFEDRYVSGLIRTTNQLLKISRYIHMNPVKAGIVHRPEDYPYSSYFYFIFGKDYPILEKNSILECFRDNPIKQYKEFVESDMCVKNLA